MNAEDKTLFQIAGLGFMAGLRSASPHAFLAAHFQGEEAQLEGTPFRWLATPTAATLLTLMAAGELAADKVPSIPARVEPGPLIGRALSGASAGAALSMARDRSPAAGAALGAVAALAGTFAGYYARRALTQGSGLPDPPVALLEDALVIVGGQLLLDEG
ncbi:MAG: DUF4126 family protein [Candidatus Promineifilaceae bacterium]|nr:DUF4126 family protein [Candidatus Promineifilaceae bacterium]